MAPQPRVQHANISALQLVAHIGQDFARFSQPDDLVVYVCWYEVSLRICPRKLFLVLPRPKPPLRLVS